MKKRIFEALKTEYASLGLSDNTLNRIAAILEGSVEKEEDIATAVKGDTAKLLATSIQGEIDGLKRAKETAENALADYKAKHPEGQGSESEEVKQLKEELATQKTNLERLQADYNDQIKQGKFNALRDQVKGKATELNVSNVAIWNDVVAGIEIKDDSTVDTILTAVKSAYEDKLKSYIGEGAAPYRGDGSPKPAEVSAKDRAAKAKEDAERVRKG